MHIARKFGMIVCNEKGYEGYTLFIKPDGTSILDGRRDGDWKCEGGSVEPKTNRILNKNLTQRIIAQRMCPDFDIPKIIALGFPVMLSC